MDQSVKRMLKLIEEDGDSFAKKAEMYYQRRPELISHVEEFYRMYRSLAERYDHVTEELRKSIPSDLQSQGSGISDVIFEPPSPAGEQKPSRLKSGPRAAGFNFFLGSGGSSDHHRKEVDELSTLTDSESESDDSSVSNYSGLSGNSGDQGLSRRIIDLEIELRETKEKLRMQQDESVDGSFRGVRNEDSEDVLAEITGCERDLTIANEELRLSEEEVTRLNTELQKYRSSEVSDGLQSEFASPAESKVITREVELEFEVNQASHLQQRIGGSEAETLDSNVKIQALMEELRIAKERLHVSEIEIATLKKQLEGGGPSEKINNLQDQLALAHKEINTLKNKLNAEKREVSKLQERTARLKTNLSDRDCEMRDLKIAMSDAELKIFPEKARIKAEISKLIEERTCLEERLKEQESRCRSLEDGIRMFQAEKAEMQETLEREIQKLKEDTAERDSRIKSERDELNEKAITLKAGVTSGDNRVNQMDKHLQQLHMEHVKLLAGAEEARKLMDELRSKAEDLEGEVERQRILILEGAEEKREVIRQLCLTLEHYRNGYHTLRQAFAGHKGVPVLAT
ncbi:PREDICTED: paramyosin-like isoform X2 [Populus euphratica]|nr:PREDICTED: paramyosin-like isoform X2 [Populus euphratica]